jgi:hypothetical protein
MGWDETVEYQVGIVFAQRSFDFCALPDGAGKTLWRLVAILCRNDQSILVDFQVWDAGQTIVVCKHLDFTAFTAVLGTGRQILRGQYVLGGLVGESTVTTSVEGID